jgi:4-aminobutyrate aminotransferase-like enzyme
MLGNQGPMSAAAIQVVRSSSMGVIMQPTGDIQNVLKIKPPLCVSRESVDYVADSLERVLTTGG